MAEMRSGTGLEISPAFSSISMSLPKEPDCMSCAASSGTEAVVIVSFCQARIRSWMLVKSLSSGVAARPARIGFRSTYTMQAAMAASSSSAWHLNRDSQNRPLTSSSLFAARAMNSLSRPMNQLRLHSRWRSSCNTFRTIRQGADFLLGRRNGASLSGRDAGGRASASGWPPPDPTNWRRCRGECAEWCDSDFP